MKNLSGRGKALLVLAGLALCGSSVRADVYLPKGRSLPSIQSAEDAVTSIPAISKIPRSFLVGDGFRFKLTLQELRIDHMGSNSKAPASKRVCMIGFSYAAPVAFFGSQVELPLFHADSLKMNRWGMNTLGDYVVHLSKDSIVAHPTLGLQLSARF